MRNLNPPRTLLLVGTNPVADHEDEYDEWYSNVHIPEILAIPGFESAQRFVLNPGRRQGELPPQRFFALYEFSGDAELLRDTLRTASRANAITTSQAVDRKTLMYVLTPIGSRTIKPVEKAIGEGLFEDGAGERPPVLLGSKCSRCSEVIFPAQLDCPACLGFGTMEPTMLEGRGHLVSCVVSDRGPKGFQVPYIQAYVKLVDGPVVFTMITGLDPAEAHSLRPGEELVMSIGTLRRTGDIDMVGWLFKRSA